MVAKPLCDAVVRNALPSGRVLIAIPTIPPQLMPQRFRRRARPSNSKGLFEAHLKPPRGLTDESTNIKT